jgi:hypothetical protein
MVTRGYNKATSLQPVEAIIGVPLLEVPKQLIYPSANQCRKRFVVQRSAELAFYLADVTGFFNFTRIIKNKVTQISVLMKFLIRLN